MSKYWPPPGLPPLPDWKPSAYRLFVVYNASKTDTLYVGARADTKLDPGLTGFPLQPGEVRVLTLPSEVISGRIWVRTGCKPVTDKKGPLGEDLVVCDTGSCGRGASAADPSGNAGLDGTPTPVQCLTESAKTCACLVEFTLKADTTDTYDVSMVDGWNAPMLIVPIPGRFAKANPATPDDPYDSAECGSVLPKGDASSVDKWCPLELQYPSFSGRKAMGCLNLCKALERPDIDRVDDTTPLVFKDLPPNAPSPMTAKKWLQLLNTAEAWMHPDRAALGAKMKDIVCCQCGPVGECEGQNANWGCDPAGVCAPGIKPFAASFAACSADCTKKAPGYPPPERGDMWKDPPATPCFAGCTPYNNTYPADWAKRRCPVKPADGKSTFDSLDLKPGFQLSTLSSTPEWPLSSTGENYPDIFKQRSPGAYSWQFDDHKSTFVTKGADYFVVVGIDDDEDPPPPVPPANGGGGQSPPAKVAWWVWVLVAIGAVLVLVALVLVVRKLLLARQAGSAGDGAAFQGVQRSGGGALRSRWRGGARRALWWP